MQPLSWRCANLHYCRALLSLPTPRMPCAADRLPQVHVNSAHEGIKFDCTEKGCGKSFTQKSDLTVSIARVRLPACLAPSHLLHMGERRVRRPI
jgi:hypothetical protein